MILIWFKLCDIFNVAALILQLVMVLDFEALVGELSELLIVFKLDELEFMTLVYAFKFDRIIVPLMFNNKK
jgi:hypothetical protein